MRRKVSKILIILAVLATPAFGQMKPISEILGGSDIEPSYLAVRCSGLWLSMAKWGGPGQLGEEGHTKLLLTAENLAEIASQLRAERKGSSQEVESENAIRDAAAIAQAYLDRFQKNYLDNGSAWSSDADFESDLKFCTALSAGEQ